MNDLDDSNRENIISPCIKNCCLDDKDICLGCFRSLDEILQWHQASSSEREVILKQCALRKVKQ